jgi:hypothetical protein
VISRRSKATLANGFKEGDGRCAWKSLPWSVMDSLHEKGYMLGGFVFLARFRPSKEGQSVWLSEEGAKLSKELFEVCRRTVVVSSGLGDQASTNFTGTTNRKLTVFVRV